jgi:hypothetical protein
MLNIASASTTPGFEQFLTQALPIIGWGMLGTFAVILILFGVTALLNMMTDTRQGSPMKSAVIQLVTISMVLTCFLVTPIVFGYLTRKKLAVAKSKQDLSTGFKVAVLLLCNPIAGILLFLMKDGDFE